MIAITIIFFINSFFIVAFLKPDPKKEGLIIDKNGIIK
jgi:hypothetical protein